MEYGFSFVGGCEVKRLRAIRSGAQTVSTYGPGAQLFGAFADLFASARKKPMNGSRHAKQCEDTQSAITRLRSI